MVKAADYRQASEGGIYVDGAHWTDTHTTVVLEGQEGAYQNIVGSCFVLRLRPEVVKLSDGAVMFIRLEF